jgi:hypothetical protein
MIHILAGLTLAAVAATGAGDSVRSAESYLAPATSQVGGVHHLVIIYAGNESRPRWDTDKLLPYVCYVDRDGKPQDWLFDSFLWSEYLTNDGVSLYYPIKGTRPAVKSDWDWMLDGFLDPAHGIPQLDACVRAAAAKLSDANHRVNLVLTMPNPHPVSTAFGAIRPGGSSLNFTRDADRLAALQWYIRTALDRWKNLDARHVRLVGFYWLRESITPENRGLVKQTADFLHTLGMKLYWIPYRGAKSVEIWRQLGIDAAMIQPNYAFLRLKQDVSRLPATARLALRTQSGVELEVDPLAVCRPEGRSRYLAYLDAGVKYGFMDHAVLGYYQGAEVFRQWAVSPDPEVRNLYDQTYRFVKGTYRLRGDTPLPALDAAPAPHPATQ